MEVLDFMPGFVEVDAETVPTASITEIYQEERQGRWAPVVCVLYDGKITRTPSPKLDAQMYEPPPDRIKVVEEKYILDKTTGKVTIRRRLIHKFVVER